MEHFGDHLITGKPLAPLTTLELEQAFRIWQGNFKHQEWDMHWRDCGQLGDSGGWIRKARKALQLSAEALGRRLDISRQAVHRMELSEEHGTISLINLIKVASAMNCQVRYAFRPIGGRMLSKMVWDQIFPHALTCGSMRRCHPDRRATQLACEASRLLMDPDFREARGWSRNM